MGRVYSANSKILEILIRTALDAGITNYYNPYSLHCARLTYELTYFQSNGDDSC